METIAGVRVRSRALWMAGIGLAATAAAAAEDDPGLRLEPVVVTAQRVEQDLRDVPLSIAVMDGEQMRRAGVATVDDLSRFFANSHISAQHGLVPYVYVRGIGTGDTLGFEQSVGTFVDGVYLGRAQFLLGSLFDVERVELIRGPQGALLGKNSVAGALNLTTVQPGSEWTGRLTALAGELQRQQYAGAATVPFAQDWALRVAVHDESRDPYLRNSGPGDDGEALRQTQWRATLAWLPREPGKPGWFGAATVEGGRARVLGEVYQLSAATPDALDFYRTYDPETETDPGDYHTSTNLPNHHSARDGANVRLRLGHAWNDVEVALISAAADSAFDFLLDGDFGSASMLEYGSVESYRMQSHELRALGQWRDVAYSAGLYGLEQRLWIDTMFAFLPDGSAALGPSAAVPVAFAPLVATGTDYSRKAFRQDTRSLSAFLQASWRLLPRWALAGSFHGTRERKDLTMSNQFDNSGAVWMALLGEEEYTAVRERDEQSVSPGASLQYDFAEEASAYVSYLSGFKSGGYNDLAPTAAVLDFDEERSRGWETGMKTFLFDRSLALNLSAFRTRYEDLQVFIYNGQIAYAANAASAVLRGAELDARWLVGAGLSVAASAGYLRALYASFPDAPAPADSSSDTQDLSGQTLIRAPRWSASAQVEYRLPPLGPVQVAAAIDGLYRDDVFLSTDLDPIDVQPAYAQVDARLDFANHDQTLRLSVRGTNLTDDLIRIESGDVPIFAGTHVVRVEPHRTVAATVTFSW